MLLLKRKFVSALWRIKTFASSSYLATIESIVETLTQKYWLIDYLPTFLKQKKGILLIRLDLIGDFVLWLDAAQAYRSLYPGQQLTLVVNSACASLARTLPHWDQIIEVNVHALRENYSYRLSILIKLRWANFATAIQPTFSRELIGDLIIRSTNATNRIGYVGDSNNISSALKNTTDCWYSRLISNNPSQTMELGINAHFMRELGCRNFMSNVPIISKITTLSSTHQFTMPYIIVAPGASWLPKTWPVYHFAALIKKLIAQFDIQIIFCGAHHEQKISAEVIRLVGQPFKMTDISGQTTLIELIEVIRNAKLLITNDSSPVHIAAATATPSICIVGGGHFGRFLPYVSEQSHLGPVPIIKSYEMACFGCRWKCIHNVPTDQAVPCVANVSVQSVYSSCYEQLIK